MAQWIKNLSAVQKMQETRVVRSLDWEDPLTEGMATHSSILAWRIPWIEKPGGLQSLGSQRVRHDLGHTNKAIMNILVHVSMLMFLKNNFLILCSSKLFFSPRRTNKKDTNKLSFPVLHYLPEFVQTYVH